MVGGSEGGGRLQLRLRLRLLLLSVLGDSNIVGTPTAALLRDAGVAMATMCHRVSLQE